MIDMSGKRFNPFLIVFQREPLTHKLSVSHSRVSNRQIAAFWRIAAFRIAAFWNLRFQVAASYGDAFGTCRSCTIATIAHCVLNCVPNRSVLGCVAGER